MGMHLADMKRFASENPASRKSPTLPGAHLPAKGFYRIKSANASQNQRQNAVPWNTKVLSWLPFWSPVPQQPAGLDQSNSGVALAGSLARRSEDSSTDVSVVQMQPQEQHRGDNSAGD